MTDIGRRRFVQGALGTTAFLALPGRLVAQAPAAAASPLPDRYPPIIVGFPHMLHGGDWNPDQWLHEPGVLEQDFTARATTTASPRPCTGRRSGSSTRGWPSATRATPRSAAGTSRTSTAAPATAASASLPSGRG